MTPRLREGGVGRPRPAGVRYVDLVSAQYVQAALLGIVGLLVVSTAVIILLNRLPSGWKSKRLRGSGGGNVRKGSRLCENAGRKSVGAIIDSIIADARIIVACEGS